MEIDPALVAVAGALTTVAGLFYRHLLAERERCKTEAEFWRDRYLDALAKAEIGAESAAKETP